MPPQAVYRNDPEGGPDAKESDQGPTWSVNILVR